MRVVAYDTSILLNVTCDLEWLFNDWDEVVISDITWQELKRIKDEKRKTERVQKQVRDLIKLFSNHLGNITFAAYKSGALERDGRYVNDDDRICYCITRAYNDYLERYGDDLEFCFYTDDCFQYADAMRNGVPSQLYTFKEREDDIYKGFKEFHFSDEELADFYEKGNKFDEIISNLLINEYVIIKYIDENENECEEVYKLNVNKELEKVGYNTFESYQFGKIKPRDCYQYCAMDSLKNNQFTLITGPAGSGKSHLALAALFEKLDKHEIDKIVMLVNPVCTDGAARLGYYKGTRDEKLLDCQVGGFLACKFGESYQAQQYIEQHKLELIPFSDLRGLDFNDKQVGILITEAQNLDKSMMKLAIQRAGEDSIIIVEGDPKAQLDMKQYTGNNNGMIAAINAFKGEDLFGMVELQKIHRSKLAEIAERIDAPNKEHIEHYGSLEYIKS